ncbi:MAG: stringent starvation protein A [Legionellales bacterium]|nr:stringent starvation protein A [Legionellales bacterium]
MAVVANKRSVMTLYSGALDLYSHQVRIVLAEKGVTVDVLDIDPAHHSAELADVNPYHTVPTLVDRDLVLYQSPIIMEYLDERFPHPPLMPVYPVARAQCRLMMYRIERDWYRLAQQIDSNNLSACANIRKELQDSLGGIAPIFADNPFFLSEEFTLVDCCLAPLLWRLPRYGIEFGNSAKAIKHYAQRLFDRDAFQASLSETEREIAAESLK